MNGLKQKEKEIGLIDLDDIDDFDDTDGTGTPESDKAGTQPDASLETSGRNKKNEGMALAGILAGSLILIVIGTMLFKVSLITTGFTIVIEAVVAAALNDSKLWVHIAVMAAQVVLGFCLGHALFLILAAAYYFVLVVALKLLELDL